MGARGYVEALFDPLDALLEIADQDTVADDGGMIFGQGAPDADYLLAGFFPERGNLFIHVHEVGGEIRPKRVHLRPHVRPQRAHVGLQLGFHLRNIGPQIAQMPQYEIVGFFDQVLYPLSARRQVGRSKSVYTSQVRHFQLPDEDLERPRPRRRQNGGLEAAAPKSAGPPCREAAAPVHRAR
jgi:hypothetical protein